MKPLLNISSIIQITCNEKYVLALTNSGAVYRKHLTDGWETSWVCLNEGDTRFPKPEQTKETSTEQKTE